MWTCAAQPDWKTNKKRTRGDERFCFGVTGVRVVRPRAATAATRDGANKITRKCVAQ